MSDIERERKKGQMRNTYTSRYIIYCNNSAYGLYENLLILHFRQSIKKKIKITVIFYLNHFFWYIRCLLSPLLLSLLVHSFICLICFKNKVKSFTSNKKKNIVYRKKKSSEKREKRNTKAANPSQKRVSKKIIALASWKSETCCWTL